MAPEHATGVSRAVCVSESVVCPAGVGQVPLAGRGGWNGGPGTGRPAHPPAVGGPVSAVGHTPAPNTAVVRGTGAGHTTHTELQQGTTYMTPVRVAKTHVQCAGISEKVYV